MADGRFHKVSLGRGEMQLVWLHGWGQSHASLLPLARLYEKSHANFLFDFPGFGQTPMLHKGADTEDYADALIRELELLPFGARVLVGHSFGCRVMVQVASKRPDLLDGMIFIGGAGLQRDRSLWWRLKALFRKTLGKISYWSDRLFRTNFLEKYRIKYRSADYKAAGELRETFVAVVSENLLSKAEKISLPTLLLYGEMDGETPVEFGEKYQRALKDARLKVLRGFGHLDILSFGAHQCQNQIDKFLDQLLKEDGA